MKPLTKLTLWGSGTLLAAGITYTILWLAPGWPLYSEHWNVLFWSPLLFLQLLNALVGWLVVLLTIKDGEG